MDAFELELKQTFLEESSQHLLEVETCFLSLESERNLSTISEIFRIVHTIKGNSRAVGFNELGEFAHALESLLVRIKNGNLSVDTEVIEVLLKSNDHLKQWVQTLKQDAAAQLDNSILLEAITRLSNAPPSAAPSDPAETARPIETAQASEERAPKVEAGVAEPTTLLDSIPPASAFDEIETSAVDTAENDPSIEVAQSDEPEGPAFLPPVETASTEAAKKLVPEYVRVDVAKLEKLVNYVGEIVILHTVLNQQRDSITSPLVHKTIAQLSKSTREIQGISMSLRMVPLKLTFQRMQRIVRDAAMALDKSVKLEISGETTELDKNVVDVLGDPLVHMIRNAVDHAIESSEERKANDKSETGTITLNAYHRGGNIVIEVGDDGRGLDAEKLRQKAIEKQLIAADRALSDKQAYELIFHPGFSTKAQVSEFSGRGVGMDVVKTVIEKQLHGSVEIETAKGKGTTFYIVLPLTAAIIDGMVVIVGTERFIIPLAQIHESLRPRPDDVQHVTGMGDVLCLRGETIPVLRLSRVLGRKSGNEKPIAESIAIVVRTGSETFSVLVDRIVGQQQVVVKQLGNEVRHVPGFGGAAILGDGKAAVILDLPELVLSRNPTGKLTRGNA